MRRRRRNPESTRPIFSEYDDAEIRATLTYGLLGSGEGEYAREKILLPIIKDLREVYADLEDDLTREVGYLPESWRDDLSPAEAELRAEFSMVKIMIIMLARLDQRIDADSLGPGRTDY